MEKCRICMQDESTIEWNEELPEYGMSFKDCYYKYTQLEPIISDPFPHVLCIKCCTELENVHSFIGKALESHRVLEQKLAASVDCLIDGIGGEDLEETKHELECVYMIENGDTDSETQEFTTCKAETTGDKRTKQKRTAKRKKLKTDESAPELEETPVEFKSNVEEIEDVKETQKKSTRKRRKQFAAQVDVLPSSEQNLETRPKRTLKKQLAKVTPKDEATLYSSGIVNNQDEKSDKSKVKVKDIPVMCSYCSKIIHNVYYLKKHEQTHKEDRTRDVVCNICGLKTFSKMGLRIHMKIHDNNREKKYKCEFCDKAFYNRGACNVHRRIHLGQMVKCPICPKEFYRQVDLDRHMASHSQAPLHSAKLKAQSKYLVHCKECNKQVSSTRFNAHRAAHMNEPLMRCTVCEKDFFSRRDCTRHMQRVHKKKCDNYDDITIYYETKRPRLSHVLLEQQEDVKPK